MSEFPILMYHALWPATDSRDQLECFLTRDSQLRDPGALFYALDERVFDCHMQAIARHGIHTPAGWEELDAPRGSGSIWITFDDGHRSNHELALPILLRHNLKAIFFITTDWIGQPDFMTEDQIRELRRAGMLIGAHGCSHRFFSEMTPETIRQEMIGAKTRLESILGAPVPALSLPGGRSHPHIRRMAREAGYRHLFTSAIALADAAGDPLDWPRIPLNRTLNPDFVERILEGDLSGIRRLARKALLRRLARQVLPATLYVRLRDRLLGKTQ